MRDLEVESVQSRGHTPTFPCLWLSVILPAPWHGPESGRPPQHFSNFNVHRNPLKIGFKCRFSGLGGWVVSVAPESTFLRIFWVMLMPGLFCE